MAEEPVRILLLEDNDSDALLIRNQLKAEGLSFAFRSVATKESYLSELEGFAPDLIIADYLLPAYDGLSALEAARELRPDAPFLFLSGEIGSDFAGETRRCGAAGYLSKDRLDQLGETVRRTLREAGSRRDADGRGEVAERDVFCGDAATREGAATVLIIDDDPLLCRTLADILTAKGFDALAAGDATAGFAAMQRRPAAVVLIDLGLPDQPGLEIMNRIKAAYPRTEAIILTGNATLESAIEATNRGAFSYLLKPCDPEQLLLQIRRAVEKRQAAHVLARRSGELQETNVELKTLYDVSLAISRTIEMERLFPEVLEILTRPGGFGVEPRAAVFLFDGPQGRMGSSLGLDDGRREACRTVPRGECLCGLAAATGEMIISKNSARDPRHTRPASGDSPHGHVVVPLKSCHQTVGVLCLHTEADVQLNPKVFHLLFTIGNQLGIAIANARLYEEARTSSLHDALTGLGNRRLLDALLPKFLSQSRRSQAPLAAIMIDIDHFKRYNDTYGHPAGDKMLLATARTLAGVLREADLAVRFGGEEFLVLLPGTSLAGAALVAEKLRVACERDLAVTISLGAATCPDDDVGGEELVARADAALYRAKQRGRNRVELASDAGLERAEADAITA